MRDLSSVNNPRHDDKVMAACSLFGVMDTAGGRFSGDGVVRAMVNMHGRGNGLGAGFAIYGLYPNFADCYALHLMYLARRGQDATEPFLRENFRVIHAEEIPTRPAADMTNAPLLRRYFVQVDPARYSGRTEESYVVDKVMQINCGLEEAYVCSSGKDMGVFKGVGYPEQIAAFYRLEQYEGYLWTAHSRFPTNTPGWWGGAHPFGLLDWTVVHNGEISSYGINKRYLEQFGYQCTMQTDTEVVTYAVDLLMRRHGLPIEVAARVLAAPFWASIERLPEEEQSLLRTLRQVYGSLLLNGPFTVIIAHAGEMIGLTDRIRLRPMTVGTSGARLYLSSEEAAIRLVCPDLERSWTPMGGEPIVASLKKPLPIHKPVAAGRGPR